METPRSIRIPPPRFSSNGIPARELRSRRDLASAAPAGGASRPHGWMIFLPEIVKLAALLTVDAFQALDRLLQLVRARLGG